MPEQSRPETAACCRPASCNEVDASHRPVLCPRLFVGVCFWMEKFVQDRTARPASGHCHSAETLSRQTDGAQGVEAYYDVRAARQPAASRLI